MSPVTQGILRLEAKFQGSEVQFKQYKSHYY